jgi:endonuclease/exonuclease/phosphatase family metal-dependent hydrolase
MLNTVTNNIKRFVIFFFFLNFCPIRYCLVWADGMKKNCYTIATWNIGHFSQGEKPYPTINTSIYSTNYNELRRVLEDSIKADVFCLNEYSNIFFSDGGKDEGITKELFFGDYAFSKIGPLLGFSCNSIFSNIKIKNMKLHLFEISKTVQSNMPRAANYYFLEGNLYLDGEKVKLVCAHTTSSASALCQSQIAELLNKYRNCDKVIMCGDWNTQDFSLFKNSGYNLANDGSYKTYPSKNYALDNIAVKGLEISDVKMVKTAVSDHYPLVCNILL